MVSIPAFPGLLRPGAAVAAHYVGETAPLCVGVLGAITTNRKGEHVAHIMLSTSGCIRFPLAQVQLDYSHSFGRHCAREWLGEQGHATQEDRAEVLAWSVESVRRGGELLAGVAGPWRECLVMGKPGKPSTMQWGRHVGNSSTPRVCDAHGWRWSSFRGTEAGDTGKALCDAALLARNLALTNDDGSLTLPPLPEVSDVAR